MKNLIIKILKNSFLFLLLPNFYLLMKKYILLLLLFSKLSIKAQDFVDNSPLFGVKGGYNYANLQGSPAENTSFSAIHSLYVGGFLEIPLGTIFSVQPEIHFSRQGAKWQTTLPNGGTYTTKMRMYSSFCEFEKYGNIDFSNSSPSRVFSNSTRYLV